MRAHENEIRAKGANVVSIGLGDMHYAQMFREETGITFPLLVDAERKAYKVAKLKKGGFFHIFKKLNMARRKQAKAAGSRQDLSHLDKAMQANMFQLGASFVFAPGNKDRYVHVSETFGDNAPVEELLAAL